MSKLGHQQGKHPVLTLRGGVISSFGEVHGTAMTGYDRGCSEITREILPAAGTGSFLPAQNYIWMGILYILLSRFPVGKSKNKTAWRFSTHPKNLKVK